MNAAIITLTAISHGILVWFRDRKAGVRNPGLGQSNG
jgi:hypothetical protein|tara:strand:- start:8107 stop:8217 length:111 start_codon:yes stop_codon:yes gene_type:complete